MAYTFLSKKNNAKSTLSSGISGVATSVLVTSLATFPATPSFLCTIWDKTSYGDPSDDPNMEIVKVTSISSGNTFIITRAQENTLARAHSSGNAIELLITVGQIQELETQINNNNPFINSVIYLGDSSTDGSWRIVVSGNTLSIQRRESGVWNEKNNFAP